VNAGEYMAAAERTKAAGETMIAREEEY